MFLLVMPQAALARDLVLELPVACKMGEVCSIQKYVDHDPGPGRMDYACGKLSLDGHTGTDFRLPDFPAMEKSIAVIAVAAGVVKAVRDNMPDVSARQGGEASVKNREAGNGLVIDHGDGWETQYSHLKRGSITVTSGERVMTGQRLGFVGLSGNTEYPHVELAVRLMGKPVDPFVGTGAFVSCTDTRRPLWSATALAALDYRPAWPLIAGFATKKPEADAARHGVYQDIRINQKTDSLVFWVDISGTQRDDRQRFTILGPDGRPVLERDTLLEADNISWFAFSGLKRPESGWATGTYRGRYTLERNGKELVKISSDVLAEYLNP